MRLLLNLIVLTGMFFCVLVPEQASAQLFRGWQGNDTRNNFSNLPGADPYAKRLPDYGAENVSEAIRNEVNGRAPVRPAPDFLSNAPMARAMMQSPIPSTHTVQRPIGEDSQVQPPLTKSYNRAVTYPYWVERSVAIPHQNPKR
jgi:hypothetical protein